MRFSIADEESLIEAGSEKGGFFEEAGRERVERTCKDSA